MLTKEAIVKLLETNDKAIIRALAVLYSNQTASEQRSESTINRNGEGFRPCHARMGTSMHEFYQKRGFLSPKQIAYWRVKDKNGDMRLAIYWRQLAEAAEAKKTAKVATSAVVQPEIEVTSRDIEKQILADELRANGVPEISVQPQICPDELEMQRMEAEGDREQTRKEEWLKAVRKGYLER
jgi:hypothetical protein